MKNCNWNGSGIYTEWHDNELRISLKATTIALIHIRNGKFFATLQGGRLNKPLRVVTDASKPFYLFATPLDIARQNDLLYQHLINHNTTFEIPRDTHNAEWLHPTMFAFFSPPLSLIADDIFEYRVPRNYNTQPLLHLTR